MYGEWCENDGSSRSNASEVKEVMDELRGFRSYLRRRLQYIRDSNRSLELQDEVTDMEFYLSVMADSDADSVHGLDGLRGFVQKLHEISYKKPVPKGFKFKSEDGTSSGTSNVDDSYSREEWEKGVVVGDLEKRLKWGKEFQDSRITENIKSLRDPETGPGEPEPAWLTFYKASRERTKLGNEPPPSASEVTPSEEQQHSSQPVTTPDWLQETTNDRIDPLVSAGLEDICERREKKVDVKPILKDDCLRQNPVFRPQQPFPPNQPQYQPTPAAYHHVLPTPAAYHPAPPTPAAYHHVPPTPAAYHPVPPTPAAYHHVPPTPAQYRPPGFNHSLTTTPSWLQDDPIISHQPTSYDYSRSAPPGGLLRQPPLTSTYIAGYGHIDIIPPLQSKPPPPSQPRIRFQQCEYQVPRDVRPNPFYNPRHQFQPVMNGPQNHHHLSNDLPVNQRRSNYIQAPAPTASSSPGNESPDWDNDDNDSSMSYGAYRKSQMQRKQVRFQGNNASTVHHPKNRRYFDKEPAKTKRGSNQQQQNPRLNTKRRSTVRQILETGQQKVYKLGQHEKIAEEVEEDDLRPPSVRSPQRRDSSPSPSPSPPPEENKDLAVLFKLALSKIKNKKELDRLIKDESALKALLQDKSEIISPTKQAKKKVKAKQDVPPVKKGKKPQQKKSKETVADTSKESPSKGFNGFSSESECGSVVSSMSTRSATRKRTNQEKSTDSETSCPGTSRSKLPPRQLAVKSGSVKGKGSNANLSSIANKSPSPQRIRKRVVKPLASDSENDQDQDEGKDDIPTKPEEKTIKRKPSNALIQECIAEFMSEHSQKKQKKTTEMGPNYWHQTKIVNEKGGQLIRPNDILVNQSLNKIDLGHEYTEVDLTVKQEIKIETDNHDNEGEGMEGDYAQNFGNQVVEPECEIVGEIGGLNFGDIPESVVEVLMEVSECENNGKDEDNQVDVSDPVANSSEILFEAFDQQYKKLETVGDKLKQQIRK